MTTNKPEVFTFNSLSEECVRLSDYEALQAEIADMERDYLTIIEAQDAEHRKQLARLQAECEKLRLQVGALHGASLPPRIQDGEALPRYGVRWNGATQPLTVPMDDGYWTPWHLAQSECENLRKLATECADYLDTNDMTSIAHGSVLHRRLLDAAKATGEAQ